MVYDTAVNILPGLRSRSSPGMMDIRDAGMKPGATSTATCSILDDLAAMTTPPLSSPPSIPLVNTRLTAGTADRDLLQPSMDEVRRRYLRSDRLPRLRGNTGPALLRRGHPPAAQAASHLNKASLPAEWPEGKLFLVRRGSLAVFRHTGVPLEQT